MIRSVGYDPQHSLLEIEFCSGKVYQYERVAADVYREFLSANSKGHFFEEQINGRYNYHRIYL